MQIELTPSTFSMRIIARTKDAVYLRLPLELQRDCDGCSCPHCKVNPQLAKWDTLVVPTHTERNMSAMWDFSHTVHMPDGAVEGFKAYVAKQGAAKCD